MLGRQRLAPVRLFLTGAYQTHLESAEAISPSRNRPRHPQIWAARV
jgi:hypothetical protein